jgi:hypothetical protein
MKGYAFKHASRDCERMEVMMNFYNKSL